MPGVVGVPPLLTKNPPFPLALTAIVFCVRTATTANTSNNNANNQTMRLRGRERRTPFGQTFSQ